MNRLRAVFFFYAYFHVMRLWILFFLLGGNLMVSAQKSRVDTVVTHALLERIATWQSSGNDYFRAGLFPSYRRYAWNSHLEKPDENIFFTALVLFTLQDVQSVLPPHQQKMILAMLEKAKPAFAFFRHRTGRPTFHFWSNNPKKVFPNSGWMNLMDQSHALPDDMDDTVMGWLALNGSKDSAKQIHDVMQSFINGGYGKVKNTYPEYEQLPAYSTWFGKKMPVDFDISVMSNVLLFVERYNLAWTKSDSATAFIVADAIQKKYHQTNPSFISPHYNRAPVILYHVARLLKNTKYAPLLALKDQVIDELASAYISSSLISDHAMLGTALHWLAPSKRLIPRKLESDWLRNAEQENMVFFIANMSSMLPAKYKTSLGYMGIGKFHYYSPPYQLALLLENICTTAMLNE